MALLTPLRAFITITNQKLSKEDFQKRILRKGMVTNQQNAVTSLYSWLREFILVE